ncbi:ketopantoate reductase family protein [Gulosibacter sp. 10]|uniref:ketopantoate reductase family protein n=1 Tax=Gulosibacter sp. 10 TaxID=1255570 RepID=UPI0015960AC7|nr:2-dehydropantoate 2-reductase [Gulosibacter sp. 10]
MRIAVIGVGAVGGVLAGLLHRAGHEVSAVVRGETAERIAADGLRVDLPDGAVEARLPVLSSVPPEAELVLLGVRSYSVRAALHEHAAGIGERPVLLLQNGLDAPETAAEVLRRPDGAGLHGGIVLFPATRTAPGRVRLTAYGPARVGPVDPGRRVESERIAAVLGDAVPARATGDLRGALWSKLLVNHVNALPAVTGLSVQQVCRHPLLGPLLARALEDAVTVGDALRVRFAGVGVLEPAHVVLIRRGRALDVVRGRLARAFGTRPNPASTLQSIRRGEPTEIEHLDGAVVRAARQAGLRAPVQEHMVGLVRRVERTGAFLPPRAVRDRMPTASGRGLG